MARRRRRVRHPPDRALSSMAQGHVVHSAGRTRITSHSAYSSPEPSAVAAGFPTTTSGLNERSGRTMRCYDASVSTSYSPPETRWPRPGSLRPGPYLGGRKIFWITFCQCCQPVVLIFGPAVASQWGMGRSTSESGQSRRGRLLPIVGRLPQCPESGRKVRALASDAMGQDGHRLRERLPIRRTTANV
jgi:hypothetical protein